MYLGKSRENASNVSYALNPKTGHISAQYHIIYDDDFTIIISISNKDALKGWSGLYKKQPINTIRLNELPQL